MMMMMLLMMMMTSVEISIVRSSVISIVGPVPRLQALSFGPWAESSGFGASRARPGSMGPGLRHSGRMPGARRLALGRPVREA